MGQNDQCLINFVHFFNNYSILITAESQNYWGDATKLFGIVSPSPSTRSLLSLISGARKNKRTELDDRKLTLWHEKVGGDKSIKPQNNQQNLQIIGGMQPN